MAEAGEDGTRAAETLALIGLGSNLASRAGSPAQTILAAISGLRLLGRVLAVSRLYRTEPVGYSGQPSFTNAAAALGTSLTPEALLEELLSIERSFGRDRAASVPKGPRTLDLDLLLMGDAVLSTPRLTLPHPALAERRFVLAPLSEIAPGALHPVLSRSVADLLESLPDAGPNCKSAVTLLPRKD